MEKKEFEDCLIQVIYLKAGDNPVNASPTSPTGNDFDTDDLY